MPLGDGEDGSSLCRRLDREGEYELEDGAAEVKYVSSS
jgi:hypothetical protein